MAVMDEGMARLTKWKDKVELAKKNKAGLEGKLESLQERGVELRGTMEKDFGVTTLKDLDKKIVSQETKVETMATELETILKDPS